MENLKEKIINCSSLKDLERVRVEIFGKKGLLSQEFAKLKDIPPAEKREFAKSLNIKKTNLLEIFEERLNSLKEMELQKILESEKIDLSIYSSLRERGATHPVKEIMDKIIDYFVALNFSWRRDRCRG